MDPGHPRKLAFPVRQEKQSVTVSGKTGSGKEGLPLVRREQPGIPGVQVQEIEVAIHIGVNPGKEDFLPVRAEPAGVIGVVTPVQKPVAVRLQLIQIYVEVFSITPVGSVCEAFSIRRPAPKA